MTEWLNNNLPSSPRDTNMQVLYMQVLYSSLVSANEELIDSKGGQYTRDWSWWPTYYRPCIRTIFTIVWAQLPPSPPPPKKRVIKSLPANVGDVGDAGSIPGLGRSPGGGNGNLLQYSYLENPTDRGAWQAIVHRVTQVWTLLKWLSTHTLLLLLSRFSRVQLCASP